MTDVDGIVRITSTENANIISSNMLDANSITTGVLTIRRDDGELLLQIKPTGEVVGEIYNAGEAAHIFARTLEQQLGFKRTD